MQAPPARRHPRPARGFTLIEIVVVLFIVGVVIAMAAAITNALTAGQRLSTTTTRMQAVDAAIVQFVMQQKRLPCPANGKLASTDPSAGAEVAPDANGCTLNEVDGVVPWRTLGLSETDATDGWNHRMTYRIDLSLAKPKALDMTWCDPAGTEAGAAGRACNTSCASASPNLCTPPADFLSTKGLEIHDSKGTGTKVMNPGGTPPTGAAYVLISAGSTGGGAYLSSGVLGTSTTTDGSEETKNYADKPLAAYYVDDGISDVAGVNTHFDDIVSRPALLTVINKAGLAPRSH